MANNSFKFCNFFVFTEPTTSTKRDQSLLVSAKLIDFHDFANVDIRSAKYQVVHRQNRELNFVALPMVRQVNIGAKLLIHEQTLAPELDVGLLIGLVEVVAFFAPAVACRHGWMVSNLLGQILKVISDVLKGLPKQWIERLGSCAFANC